MFKLQQWEFESLRFQFGTSKILASARAKKGGRKYLPLAFTEQGVAMLSSVLRSKRAIEVNIQIMRGFVKMRKLVNGENITSIKLEDLSSFVLKQSQKTNQELRKIWILLDNLK